MFVCEVCRHVSLGSSDAEVSASVLLKKGFVCFLGLLGGVIFICGKSDCATSGVMGL